MREDKAARVRSINLFADMQDEHFSELMRVAYLQSFPPQVQLISEGEAADFLHVVIEGSVELFAKANGRETTMAMVHPVSTFILAAVLKDARYLMSARTLHKSTVLMIPAQDIRDVMERDANFDRAIINELASCYRSVIKAHKDLKLRTGLERLANYVLRHYNRHGNAGKVVLPTDKRTLAGFLGMTPENLSRAFGNLKSHGVDINGATIHVNDLERLNALARPDPLIDDPSV